jgi:hypothetical protein
MKVRLLWIVCLVLAFATIGSAAKSLGDRESCPKGETCSCGSPPINVPEGCECQVDGPSGTGTAHCSAVAQSGFLSWAIIGGLVGVVVGATGAFLVMRNRGTGAVTRS